MRRRSRKTLRLGQFEALDLTFRGLHIVVIPMTDEGTITVVHPDTMESRRTGSLITFHKKGEIPTITPLTDDLLGDDFPA